MNNELIQNILNCQDLWVVLKNRFGDQYVESYHLTNILISGDKFWGKFSNVHSSDPHKDIGADRSLSYAYNNFSNVVCSMCLSDYMERYYSSYTYSHLEFIAKNSFQKIWNNSDGGDIKDVKYSVESGLKLKLLVESEDGYIHILNSHTVEVYDDGFSLQTDFDGFPDRLRYFQSMEKMGEEFDMMVEENDDSDAVYPATTFYKTNFYLTSFILKRSGQLIYRNIKDGALHRDEFPFKKIELWSQV